MVAPLKLWVDDERDPPDETWDWVTTSEAAIALLDVFQKEIGTWCPREVISFDHDLGGDDTTRPVVLWMIEHGFRFNEYRVHTANPVGREWLEGMIERYLR
jgi:hypothetical protein